MIRFVGTAEIWVNEMDAEKAKARIDRWVEASQESGEFPPGIVGVEIKGSYSLMSLNDRVPPGRLEAMRQAGIDLRDPDQVDTEEQVKGLLAQILGDVEEWDEEDGDE